MSLFDKKKAEPERKEKYQPIPPSPDPEKKDVQKAGLSARENVVKLICTKEAVMPGVGHFKPGDEIVDPILVKRIGKTHPFFTVAGDTPTNQEGK